MYTIFRISTRKIDCNWNEFVFEIDIDWNKTEYIQ